MTGMSDQLQNFSFDQQLERMAYLQSKAQNRMQINNQRHGVFANNPVA